ncbi:MAG: hypothetical protein HDT38_05785 [Clostridiales bacterium]|nr:hypothetical protein [Clostridiales bacterium]
MAVFMLTCHLRFSDMSVFIQSHYITSKPAGQAEAGNLLTPKQKKGRASGTALFVALFG